MKISYWVIFAIVSIRVGSLLAAESPSTSGAIASKSVDPLNDVNFDRAVGAVPAFDALGLSPETVTSPSTPRELAADLLNGVDHNGVLQHGLAIEVAPLRMIGLPTRLDDYRASAVRRWIYNFSASIATSKATDKSDAVQVALGFKEVLYESDDHDPYRNNEIDAAARPIRQAVEQANPSYDQPPPPAPTGTEEAFKEAVAKFEKNKWQGMIWTVAIAPTWNSQSGKLSELSGSGFTTWSAFAYGLHQTEHPLRIGNGDPINVQFISELRYRDAEHITDPKDKTHVAIQNSLVAAGRLRMGTDTFNGFVEGAYVRVWHGLDGDGNNWRGAVGVEKKLADNIWLVISAGEQFGDASAKTDNLFAVSSLRFGTADKAQFAPP